MALRTQLLSLSDVSAGEIGRWRELAAGALEPNPFYEPEYLLPVVRGLGDADKVSLLTVSKNGDWIACAPVHQQSRWGRDR